MNTNKIGDIIKSMDFPGRTDCYFIGRVLKIQNNCLHCETIKIVVEGKEKDITPLTSVFKTPPRGEMMFDDTFQRIEIVG